MTAYELVLPTDLLRLAPQPPRSFPTDERRPAPRNTPYYLDGTLANAINAALAVDQPLLVTGEPGCGKSSLVWEIARQLGVDLDKGVIEFVTRSTSTSRDLFYRFDAMRRFYDASVRDPRSADPSHYVDLQGLGLAYDRSAPSVVLIDEIDKAPRDLPNDLLHEIDRREFVIAETGTRLRPSAPFFVLITSNGERRLPDAFLRRCVYAHIDFPPQDHLRTILSLHATTERPAEWVAAALRRFEEVRALGAEGALQKTPGTSELLVWTNVLWRRAIKVEEILKSPLRRLPGIELLVKQREDLDALTKA